MPSGRKKRKEIAALVALQMLVQGAFFDSRTIRELPFSASQVSRVFHNLIDSGVIARTTRRGKYLLTDQFLEAAKGEIARGTNHRIFIPSPPWGSSTSRA